MSRAVRPGCRRRARQRRGVETLELLLVLPILVIVTFAIMQFGMVMVVQEGVTQAAIVGAREAGKETTITVVREAVDAVLVPFDIVISNAAGSGTKVVLEDGMAAPIEYGDPLLMCTPHGPVLGTGDVRVTVCIRLNQAKIPDPLCAFGFAIGERCFEISSMVRKE